MKALNVYIDEKLIINKDIIDDQNVFEQDEPIIHVYFSELPVGTNDYKIFINIDADYVFKKVINRNNKEIDLYTRNKITERTKSFPDKVYINQFGFYEAIDKDEIFLNLENGKNFVETLIKRGYSIAIPAFFDLSKEFEEAIEKSKFTYHSLAQLEKLLTSIKTKITKRCKK